MNLISYLMDEGVINSRHLKVLQSHPGYEEMDQESAVIKILKVSEATVLKALTMLSHDKKYFPIDSIKPSALLDELNSKIIKHVNAVVVEVEGNTARVAYLDSNAHDRQKVRRELSAYNEEEVVAIPCKLEQKLAEVYKRLNLPVPPGINIPLQYSTLLDLIICDAIAADASDIHIGVIWDKFLNDYIGFVQFRVVPEIMNWNKHAFRVEDIVYLKTQIYTRAGRSGMDGNTAKGHMFNSDLAIEGYDFRVSVLPTNLRRNHSISVSEEFNVGYIMDLRIQDMNKTALEIDELNLGHVAVKTLHEIADVGRGLLAITGAFGSGKNTTTAGIINSMIAKKPLIAFEFGDPIEYRLPIYQIPVDNYEDMKSRIKSTKTQDPDAIIITEFRDADMGHLIKDAVISNTQVITTLHISRVWDFLEKFREYFGEDDSQTMLSYTTGICHQVMFRELCPNCKKELSITDMSAREMLAWNALKLQDHPVYVADPIPSTTGACICKLGYLTSRLPAAEVLFFNQREPKSVELMRTLLSIDSIPRRVTAIKAYMHAEKALLEYTIRERLIDGVIDFRKAVMANVTEEVIL